MSERTITTRIGTQTFEITSDDVYLDHVGDVFEPELIALFSAFDLSGQHVLDVGANIGCTALYFQQVADKVSAFEPSPTTADYLRRNVRAAGSSARVTVHECALGEKDGASTLTFAASNRSGGFVDSATPVSGGHVTETVKVRRGDALLGNSRLKTTSSVGAMKIDVEGFELSVLRGLKHTLRSCRPIVFLEMNHFTLNALHRIALPDFIDELRTIFPIVYATHAGTYLDLHDPAETYIALHRNIVGNSFMELVCSYDKAAFSDFYGRFRKPDG